MRLTEVSEVSAVAEIPASTKATTRTAISQPLMGLGAPH
jgi:hypothetical protein